MKRLTAKNLKPDKKKRLLKHTIAKPQTIKVKEKILKAVRRITELVSEE